MSERGRKPSVEGTDLKETTFVDRSSGSRHDARPPAEVLGIERDVKKEEEESGREEWMVVSSDRGRSRGAEAL